MHLKPISWLERKPINSFNWHLFGSRKTYRTCIHWLPLLFLYITDSFCCCFQVKKKVPLFKTVQIKKTSKLTNPKQKYFCGTYHLVDLLFKSHTLNQNSVASSSSIQKGKGQFVEYMACHQAWQDSVNLFIFLLTKSMLHHIMSYSVPFHIV